jgi:hypothetical protein
MGFPFQTNKKFGKKTPPTFLGRWGRSEKEIVELITKILSQKLIIYTKIKHYYYYHNVQFLSLWVSLGK